MSADVDSPGVSLAQSGTGLVLALRGDLNLELAHRIHDAALEGLQASGNLIVDCSAATYVGGPVAQVLLALERALQQVGRSLEIRGASEDVRRYLGWAGLQSHFVDAEVQAKELPRSSTAPAKRRRARRKSAL